MNSNYEKLRKLTWQMRKYQNQFYREKRKDALPKALNYEAKVDELLRAMDQLEEAQQNKAGTQGNIFDQGGVQ